MQLYEIWQMLINLMQPLYLNRFFLNILLEFKYA